jgi:predicted amidohydrolase YtcJ
VGSIEPGKDADIVIWENDPFSVDYKAYSTIVSGKVVYELDKKVI